MQRKFFRPGISFVKLIFFSEGSLFHVGINFFCGFADFPLCAEGWEIQKKFQLQRGPAAATLESNNPFANKNSSIAAAGV